MPRIVLATLLFCVCLAVQYRLPAADIEPQLGQPVTNFTLQDFRGAAHALDDLRDQKLVVLAFVGTECPLAKLYMAQLVELAAGYQKQGVSVLAISSNQQDSITELAAFARTHNVAFPILKDVGNRLADQVGARRTPEVFLLDAARTIRYAGRIDDHYAIGVQRKEATSSDLIKAIDELLAGKPVSNPKTETVGCRIGRVRQAKSDAEVTYSNQIARLFQARCVECHRSGEIAPFALTQYEDAVGWAEMIDEVVREERMPPWHADAHYGKFLGDRRLLEEEKRLIHQWVADGAPQGNPTELPEPVKYVSGWQLPREPDQTIYMSDAPFRVPAEGEVKYQNFVVDPRFKEDKWVQAAQVLPGNRAVVHHIIVFLQPPGSSSSQAEQQHFTAYVPGYIPKPYAPGMAKRIPAGSKLRFQVHYTPIGSPQTDRSQVAFIYADADQIKQQAVTNVAGNTQFVIPRHDPNYRVEAKSNSYSKDVMLLSMSPHMHFRGKAFRYDAVFPDGTTETLLDVPHYDFNWQTEYRLEKPKLLPAGTQLHCVAHFDNSADNLANPDPSKDVRWGDQTWEEMMLGYYEIAFSGEAPSGVLEGRVRSAGIDVAAIEKLLAGSPKEIVARFDTNRDGKTTRDELPAPLQPLFKRLDSNQDGQLDADELEQSLRRLKKR